MDEVGRNYLLICISWCELFFHHMQTTLKVLRVSEIQSALVKLSVFVWFPSILPLQSVGGWLTINQRQLSPPWRQILSVFTPPHHVHSTHISQAKLPYSLIGQTLHCEEDSQQTAELTDQGDISSLGATWQEPLLFQDLAQIGPIGWAKFHLPSKFSL